MLSPEAETSAAAEPRPGLNETRHQVIEGASVRDKWKLLRPHAADVCALSVLLWASGWMAVTTRRTVTDDAFITYRYAHNLATGHGFVYNLGDARLGTTAPFYGLMLGILGIPDPGAIPTISMVIGMVSLIASGVALYAFGRLNQTPLAGFLSALLFVLSPAVVRVSGLETTFEIAVVLWAFVSYRLGRTNAAAVLLAIAILTRMDAVIALCVIGAHFVFTQKRLPLNESAIVCAVLLPFALAAFVYYGSPVPITLAAKQAQAEAGTWWQPFLHGLIDWMKSHAATGGYGKAVFWLSAGLGAGVALVRSRWWLLIVGWAALHAIGYSMLRPAFYDWYATPVMLGVAVTAALGADFLVTWIRVRLVAWPTAWLPGAVAAAGCLGVFTPLLVAQRDYGAANHFSGATPHVVITSSADDTEFQRYAGASRTNSPAEEDVRFHLYRATGEWLRENGAADASVAYYEIGYLGYYSERRIIDEMALIQPDVAPHLASRDYQWVFQRYQPDYIVLSPYSLCNCLSQGWFNGQYHFVVQLSMSGTYPLRIYERAQ